MHVASTAYASRIQRFRLPRVCVAVVGEDPADIIERAESMVRDNPFMEFRLDYLSNPAAGLPPDAWLQGAELQAFTAEVFGENSPSHSSASDGR